MCMCVSEIPQFRVPKEKERRQKFLEIQLQIIVKAADCAKIT